MFLSNLSQVINRNDDLLMCQSALLINMPDDDLAKVIIDQNTACQLCYYDTNFENHQAHLAKQYGQCEFSSQYQTATTHDLVIMSFPKSKSELAFTLAQLAHCTTPESRLLIVGENKGGIKSLNKLVQKQSDFCEKIDAARHCILFELRLNNQNNTFNLEEWFHYYTIKQNGLTVKVAALPGVFSQAKLDVGTAILLDNLTKPIEGKVLDFGCGSGVIACYLGLMNKDVELHLADVSALALASSAKSLELNKLSGKTIATNSISKISEQYNHVISNPPFHQGIKTHYQATERFLANIKKQMLKGGTLTIVANSFLKYQPIMEKSFSKVCKLCVKQGFTIYRAQDN